MTDEEILLEVSKITEFNDLSDFLNDSYVDSAMNIVVKLIVRDGIVPPDKIPPLIAKLQALATKFHMQAAAYKTIMRDRAGSDNNHKKEVYYSLADALTKLADALKYTAKY